MRYTRDGHCLMIAPSRTGKARDVLVSSALTNRDGAVILDVKGELAAITARARRALGQRVVCLNPFGLHTGPPWNLPQDGYNPLAHLDPDSPSFISDVENIAGALIVHSEQESAHWADSSRSLVGGAMVHEVHEARTAGRVPSLARVRGYLVMSDGDFESCMQSIVAGTTSELVRDRLSQFTALTNELRAVRSTAKAQTTFLSDPVIARSLDRNDFDFAELKGDEPLTVYIILPSRLIVRGMTYNRYLRLILQSALDAMMATPKRHNRPVHFLVDEMYSLGTMPVFERAMSEGAGYGIQLMPVLQNLGQLKELYRNNWETFLANSACTTFFTPRDNTTAEYISKLLGNYTANTQTIGHEGQVSVGETGRPLMRTEELMAMGEHEMIVFLRGCPNPLRLYRSPYFKEPWGLRGLYDPNPYHVE
jgi:type IV secretion system protein VirD4